MPKFRKSYRKSLRKRRTRRRPTCISGKLDKPALIGTILEMLNTIKVYHWNTHSFSQHKATDELYSRLGEHTDKFVEVLLGKEQSRLHLLNAHTALFRAKTTSDFRSKIHEYREFFIGMNECLDSHKDSDLLNIRDETLADLNQFLYLLTLQ